MELDKDRIGELEDLLTHPGWQIYKRLLNEVLESVLANLEEAKDWPDYTETRGMVKILKLDVLPLVEDTISDWKDELINTKNLEEEEE